MRVVIQNKTQIHSLLINIALFPSPISSISPETNKSSIKSVSLNVSFGTVTVILYQLEWYFYSLWMRLLMKLNGWYCWKVFVVLNKIFGYGYLILCVIVDLSVVSWWKFDLNNCLCFLNKKKHCGKPTFYPNLNIYSDETRRRLF